MKPPSDGELIELEKEVLRPWQMLSDDGIRSADRIVHTLEYLIARARFHNARQSAQDTSAARTRGAASTKR